MRRAEPAEQPPRHGVAVQPARRHGVAPGQDAQPGDEEEGRAHHPGEVPRVDLGQRGVARPRRVEGEERDRRQRQQEARAPPGPCVRGHESRGQRVQQPDRHAGAQRAPGVGGERPRGAQSVRQLHEPVAEQGVERVAGRVRHAVEGQHQRQLGRVAVARDRRAEPQVDGERHEPDQRRPPGRDGSDRRRDPRRLGARGRAVGAAFRGLAAHGRGDACGGAGAARQARTRSSRVEGAKGFCRYATGVPSGGLQSGGPHA